MSLAEIKSAITDLTSAEKEELRRFLFVERLQSDPEWKAEMGRRIDKVRAGHFYTQEDVDRVRVERRTSGD
ncbi:MAG TPA: hypothetical protein VGM54_10500 [Chthoniobacter sp.]|jgi:hypothetical protein